MTARQRLPNRRLIESFELKCGGIEYCASVGFFPSGTLGEVFLRAAKPSSAIDGFANDAGILASLLLQHGVPVDEIRHSLGNGPLVALLDRLGQERP
jgi:ribonucleoside-diphosphate reductase alpha chain